MLDKQFEALRQTGKLPTPTPVGLEVMRATQREDVSLEDVAAILKGDAMLTQRLVELANIGSAEGRNEVTTAHAAAMRLGLKSVRTISLGFSLLANNRKGPCETFDYDAFWSHSLAVAAAAQTIAGLRRDLAPTEAFTCGLLQGLGRLALANVHPVAYQGVLERARGRSDARLAEIETKICGVHHRELAAAMLQDWRVPARFCAAIAHVNSGVAPEDLRNPSSARVARMLEDALDMARALTADIDSSPELCRRLRDDLQRVQSRLELDDLGFRAVWDLAVESWRAWGQVVNLRATAVLGVNDIRRRARKALGVLDDEDMRGDEYSDTNRTSGLRILLVGAELTRDARLSEALTEDGHVVTARTAMPPAGDAALAEMPHVVLVDWTLSESSGAQAVRVLRGMDGGTHAHCVMVVPRDKDAHQLEAFEAGAGECLVRPFDARVVVARVRAALRVVQLEERVEDLQATREAQIGRIALLSRNVELAGATDALTGIHSRAFAADRLRSAFELSREGTTPLSVLLLDIDGFGRIDEMHGRATGDAVLRATARVVAGALRKGDAACRVGADEFLAICPGADAAAGAEIAERLRAAVRDNKVRCTGFEGCVTVSIGVVQVEDAHANVDALWNDLDRRLRAARTAGTDRVVLGDGTPRLRSAG